MRDLIQVREIIEELVRKADRDPLYRPWGGRFDRATRPPRRHKTAKPAKPATKPDGVTYKSRNRKEFIPLQGEQMSLFPCIDLSPGAYL
jgi:hypothetical protein